MYNWKILTEVYAEYISIIMCLESIEKQSKVLQPVLMKFLVFYGLWSLDKHLVELYEGGFGSGNGLGKLLRGAILEMCGEIKDEAVSMVDALAPTDFILNSVLGQSDGKVRYFLYTYRIIHKDK